MNGNGYRALELSVERVQQRRNRQAANKVRQKRTDQPSLKVNFSEIHKHRHRHKYKYKYKHTRHSYIM